MSIMICVCCEIMFMFSVLVTSFVFFNTVVYFCLHWVLVAVWGLSLVAVHGLLVVASVVAEHRLWVHRLQ